MDGRLNVYTAKWWTDQGQGRLWTVNDRWYTFVQLVIGLLFGLTQPCVERIVAHLLGWICYCFHLCRSKPGNATNHEDPDENTQLLENSRPKSKKSRSCCRKSECCNIHYSRNFIAKTSSLSIVILGIAYVVAGTFVTTIPTDKVALSGSKKCGLWGLKDNALPTAQDEDGLIQGQKETRAGQYARDCYGPQSTTSLDQCLIFRKPFIATSKFDDGQQCPFVNETYCGGNGFTAARFTTNGVDARKIGVNAENAPTFNRTMICVPLNIYQGFVEKTSTQPGHWGYKLGPVNSDEYASDYTFRQYGDPFTYDVRSYTMSTYTHVYSKSENQNYWKPIPELNIRPELSTQSKPYSLTLHFINSCRIFYKDLSSDPIFPADRRWPRNPDLWTNNDSRARPLACVDWIEVYSSKGKQSIPGKDDEDHDENLVFTKYALNKSTAFHAIEFRGATGLDAQDKIQDDTSLPLSQHPPQWIVESWGLFNASLARIQFDALDIANGTGWDKEPLYDQKVPNWAQGKLCQIFTFQLPKGYDNIRIWPTFGILMIPLALWLIGRETKEEFDEKNKNSECFGNNKLMGVEWVCWRIEGLFSKMPDQQQQPEQPATADGNVQGSGGGTGPQVNAPGKNSSNILANGRPPIPNVVSRPPHNNQPTPSSNVVVNNQSPEQSAEIQPSNAQPTQSSQPSDSDDGSADITSHNNHT